MEKLTKAEVEEKICGFFRHIENKTPKEIKKIKELAMHHNIKLKDKRRLFCKKCFSTKLKVKSVKRGIKTTQCESCGGVFRWKIKTF